MFHYQSYFYYDYLYTYFYNNLCYYFITIHLIIILILETVLEHCDSVTDAMAKAKEDSFF